MRNLLLAVPVMLLLSSSSAVARASTIAGAWSTPVGKVQLKETPQGVVGTLVEPDPGCHGLAKGEEVVHGDLLDDTFSGELRLCLEGSGCSTPATWLSTVLVADAKKAELSGAVERGNAVCHARLGSKNGGVKLHKVVVGAPKVGARQKQDPKAVAAAQALIEEGARLMADGNAEAARTKFEASLKVAPLPEAQNGIGVTYYLRNDGDSALEAYHRAMALDPDFGDAYYNVACLYAQRGKKDLAFKFLGVALHNKLHDLGTLDDDPDLRPLREDPRYAKLKQAVAAEQGKQPGSR